MATPARLIVFDCDGTLVDSQAVIIACAREAFRACDLEPPAGDRIKEIVGLSLEPAMRSLLGRDDPVAGARIADAYRAAFLDHRSRAEFDEPLFDGVIELLDRLMEREMLLGVATGKSMRGLRHVIEHHGLERYFVTLQTADLHPSKPHPSMLITAMQETGAAPCETVIVGDTTFDIEMGRAAGCRSIGVSYGNHPVDRLHAAGAEVVLDAISELHAFV